jgi:hypothetical protein
MCGTFDVSMTFERFCIYQLTELYLNWSKYYIAVW